MEYPKLILLISGKRKSGKDFICEKLKALIGETNCCIVRISGYLKQLYAENHQLKLDELMSEGPYKEQYRRDMIHWSDGIRKTDPGFFCKSACDLAPPKKIWIVSDVRRKTDLHWFKENYSSILTIRIVANSVVRQTRGWIFTKGVDDVESECGLDDVSSWDIQMDNNDTEDSENIIQSILNRIPV